MRRRTGQQYPRNSKWGRTINWGNRKLKHGVIKPAGSAWALNTVWGAAEDGEGDNIVWGTTLRPTDAECDNIVWGTSDLDDANIAVGSVDDAEGDNIVWGTVADGEECDNIVWGTACGVDEECDNIVWGTECGGADCDNIVWGTSFDDGEDRQHRLGHVLRGRARTDCDNIVWGTSGAVDAIVWGSSSEEDNVTWGCAGEETPVFDDPDVAVRVRRHDLRRAVRRRNSRHPIPTRRSIRRWRSIPESPVVPPPALPVAGGGL